MQRVAPQPETVKTPKGGTATNNLISDKALSKKVSLWKQWTDRSSDDSFGDFWFQLNRTANTHIGLSKVQATSR